MRNYLLLFALCGICLLTACEKDDCPEESIEPQLELQFKLTQAGNEIGLGETMTDAQQRDFQLNELKFYLSDIELTSATNSRLFSEIELINFSGGTTSITAGLAEGSYNSISFGIGVDSALNGQDPSNFANDHPLSIFNNMHWNWSSLYRFIIFEGRVDTAQSGNFDNLIVYHTGTDPLYRTVSLNIPELVIESGSASELVIEIDIDQILNGDGGSIDLITEGATHTTDNQALARKVSDNFAGAFQ